MKRKKLIVFLASVMAGCGAVGLASCGGAFDYKPGDSIIDEKDITYTVTIDGNETQEYTGKVITVKYLVGGSAYVTLSGEKPEEMKLDGYAGDVTSLSLKELENKIKINGKDLSVTGIAAGAFAGCETLESADLSKSNGALDFTVGDNAFAGCTALSSVIFPKELYVDDNAVGDYVFRGCENLTTVDLGDRFSQIGEGAFMSCASLESVTLPQKMKKIENRLFDNCVKLTTVTYPERLRSVGDSAFRNTAVTNTLGEVSSLRYIGESAFEGTKIQACELPSSVTYVGNRAFYNCTELESIKLPFIGNTINSSQDNFFKNVFGVEEIETPRTLSLTVSATASIPRNAFADCNDLYSVSINFATSGVYNIYAEDGVYFEPVNVVVDRSISQNAFAGCRELSVINLPASVTEIGVSAFENCAMLKALTIPEKTAKIGERAFAGCRSLAKLSVPASVNYLGGEAFADCLKLSSLEFAGYDYTYINSNGLETSGSFGVLGKYFSRNTQLTEDIGNYLYACGTGEYIPSALKTITLNGVKDIADGALYGWEQLETINVNFAEKADKAVIGERAFAGCEALATLSVNGAEKVDKISARAFEGCRLLPYSQVLVFDKITGLGSYAYSGCDAFDNVTLPATLCDVSADGYLNGNIFYNCKGIREIVIESYSFEGEMQTVSVGKIARLFGADPSVTSSSYNANDRYTHYSASLGNGYASGIPYSLKTVVVKGVQTLDEFALNAMRSLALVSVEFDSDYKEGYVLADRAFADCDGLFTIEFDTVQNVAFRSNTFMNCSRLRKLDLPVSVDRRDSALSTLYALEEMTVDIPSTYTGSAELATLFNVNYNNSNLYEYKINTVNLINSEGKSYKIPAHLFRDALQIREVNFATEKRAEDGTVETYGVNAIGENAFTNSGVNLTVSECASKFGGVAYIYNDWVVYSDLRAGANQFNTAPEILVPLSVAGIADEVLDWVDKLYYGGETEQAFEAVFKDGLANRYTAYYFSANAPESYGPHWYYAQQDGVQVVSEWVYESVEYVLNFAGADTKVTPAGALTKEDLPANLRSDGYIWYDNSGFEGERITFPYYSKTKVKLYARFENHLVVEGDYTFVEKDGMLVSNNAGKNDTAAELTIYVNDSVNISFLYSVSCENGNDAVVYDNLSIRIERMDASGVYKPIVYAGLSSPLTGQKYEANDWKNFSRQFTAGERIVISYIKDSSDNTPYPGNDCAYIRNLKIEGNN